jgi:hypothetical protein
MTGALSASVARPLLLAATLKAGSADRLEDATAVERERSGRMERSMLTSDLLSTRDGVDDGDERDGVVCR